MIYAYDKAAQIPLVDLYDKLMMLAEIAAAKDMYEKGVLEIKDFRKEYGDIIFSNDAYQDWYNDEFGVNKFIDRLYKQGIDPVRSQEGRVMLSQYINSRNYGELAKRRAWDENMQAYKKSIADNARKYDPEFESWRIGGDINNWGDRPFTQSSIIPYENLQEMTLPSFSTIKPHLLTSLEAYERLGEDYDPRNNYEGVTKGDMEQVMGEWMPGVRNDILFLYHRELAKNDLIREGNENPTPGQIDRKLVENAITSNAGIMTPLEMKPDDWEMLRQKHRDAIELENLRASNDAAIASIKNNGNGDDGNYLHVISDQLATVGRDLRLTLLGNAKRAELELISQIQDESLRNRAVEDLIQSTSSEELMVDFLQNPTYSYDGQHSVAKMIMSMEDNVGNNKSTHDINNILENFATTGDSLMSGDYLIKRNGGADLGEGVIQLSSGTKVATPHELLGNIIKYSISNNRTINTPWISTAPHGPKITRDMLVDKLENIAGGYERQGSFDISDREPGNVAASTYKVRVQGGKNVIVAPDSDGKKYIWVKVTSVSNGVFTGSHDGYWVNSDIMIGDDGLPVTDARARIYGAGVEERKEFGNAGVTTEWGNLR